MAAPHPWWAGGRDRGMLCLLFRFSVKGHLYPRTGHDAHQDAPHNVLHAVHGRGELAANAHGEDRDGPHGCPADDSSWGAAGRLWSRAYCGVHPADPPEGEGGGDLCWDGALPRPACGPRATIDTLNPHTPRVGRNPPSRRMAMGVNCWARRRVRRGSSGSCARSRQTTRRWSAPRSRLGLIHRRLKPVTLSSARHPRRLPPMRLSLVCWYPKTSPDPHKPCSLPAPHAQPLPPRDVTGVLGVKSPIPSDRVGSSSYSTISVWTVSLTDSRAIAVHASDGGLGWAGPAGRFASAHLYELSRRARRRRHRVRRDL